MAEAPRSMLLSYAGFEPEDSNAAEAAEPEKVPIARDHQFGAGGDDPGGRMTVIRAICHDARQSRQADHQRQVLVPPEN